MKVNVLAFGMLREQAALALGQVVSLELPEGAAVADVFPLLGLDPGPVAHVLIDGTRASPSDLLHDGAELTLMPAFAGGT